MISVALFGADEDSVLVRLRLRESGMVAVGAYVQEVQSGALDLDTFLTRQHPDVVIYDFVRPGTSSRPWIRRLHRICTRHAIPCVLSVRDVSDLRRLPVDWAACVLVRPYDATMARLAIREALRHAPRDDAEGEGEAAA